MSGRRDLVPRKKNVPGQAFQKATNKVSKKRGIVRKNIKLNAALQQKWNKIMNERERASYPTGGRDEGRGRGRRVLEGEKDD